MDKPESTPGSAEPNLPPSKTDPLIWSNGVLGFLLGLLALSGLPVLPMSPAHFFVPAFLLLLAGLVWPGWRLKIPSALWKIIPWLLLAFFVLDVFMGQRLMEALVRMNIFLVLYRCLGIRTPREDLQLLLVCLFLVVITGVFSVSFVFAPQIILFACLGMLFLSNVNALSMLSVQPSRESAWRRFHWEAFLQGLRERWEMRGMVLGLASFAAMLVVGTLIFLLFPRLDLENRFQFLQLQGVGSLSGFSEDVSLNAITDIVQSQGLAMRIDAPDEVLFVGTPYWRMLALDEYRDGRFRVSDWLSDQQRPLQGRTQTPESMGWEGVSAMAAPYDEFWTFFFEPGMSRFLPLGGPFREIRMPEESNYRHVQPLQVIAQTFINGSVYIYQLRGMQPGERRLPDPAFQSRLEGADRQRNHYPLTTLALPVNEASRDYLHGVIDELRREEEDLHPLEMADRISGYLQSRHGYSLQSRIPPGDKDIVVRWLESGEDAHCEYFAAGMILLARAAGLPARMAVGFYGGSMNAFEQHIMVRLSDAHAWVEIYHEGFWYRYDPTPASDGGPRGGLAEDGQEGMVFGEDSSFAAFLDGLRMLWYRRIVSFDERDQTDFIARQRERIENLRENTRSFLLAFREGLLNWLRGPWDFPRIATMFGLSAGLILILWALQRFGWKWRLLVYRNQLDIPSHPFRRRAGLLLRRLRKKEQKRALPEELLADGEEIKDALLQLRFGRAREWHHAPEKTFRRARRLLRAW